MRDWLPPLDISNLGPLFVDDADLGAYRYGELLRKSHPILELYFWRSHGYLRGLCAQVLTEALQMQRSVRRSDPM
jgi:hypothetical protein